MIIKLIAETEAELKRFGGRESVEHLGVKEYFLAGNKFDADGSFLDFHEWNGEFRYLMSTLNYFYEVLNDDRRKASMRGDSEMPITIGNRKQVIPMVKRGMGGNIQALDISKLRTRPSEDASTIEEYIGPVDDEFVEDPPTIAFQAGEITAQDEVDEVAEVVVDKLQKEAEAMRSKQGLRILPNKE